MMQYDPYIHIELQEQELRRTMARNALERELRKAAGATPSVIERIAALVLGATVRTSANSQPEPQTAVRRAVGF
jgi:hypothetical protein